MKWWALPILWIISWSAWAAQLDLTWTASTSSEVTKYIVYEGTTPGVYTKTYNVGKPCTGTACSYTLTVTWTGTRYLSIKGRDASGNMSGFSNQTTVVVP